jgi:hypothetical protein
MSNSDNGQWEKKSAEQIFRDKYRFTGERYGFRGVSSSIPSDWIPQIKGLYAFPEQDNINIDVTE